MTLALKIYANEDRQDERAYRFATLIYYQLENQLALGNYQVSFSKDCFHFLIPYEGPLYDLKYDIHHRYAHSTRIQRYLLSDFGIKVEKWVMESDYLYVRIAGCSSE